MVKNRLFLITLLLCIFKFGYGETRPDPENWTDGGSGYKSTAYDVSWFNESDSELTIKTNSELGGLAKLVNEDNISFSGKTINLAADVDMLTYNWVSIENFEGVFNGNGHIIYNLTTNKTSNGLFSKVTYGEIKNLLVTGTVEELNSVVGGITGTLSEGKIENCAYVGTISVSNSSVNAGGLVGSNEEGSVLNSYFYGQAPTTEEITYGNIAGYSNGEINNCYFLENDVDTGIGEGTGTATAGTRDAFVSGEIAWLLNQFNGVYSHIWAQGGRYPVFADDDNAPIYRIYYPEVVNNGTIEGVSYASQGTTVSLVITTEEGYIYENLAVTGAEIFDECMFVMPDTDVVVTCDIIPIPTDRVVTFAPDSDEITSSSFMTKWNNVKNATNYLITVREGEEILEEYNELSTGNVTELKVEGLSSETTYSYSLKAVIGEEVTEPSDWRMVTTKSQLDITSIEKFSFKAQWNSIEDVIGYSLVLTKEEEVVESVELDEISYKFEELMPQTEYQLSITIIYEDRKEEWSTVTVQTAGDYGQQLNNSGFEYWEGSGNSIEPVSWNSFMSASGNAASTAQNFGAHMEQSDEVRPGTYGESSVKIWTTSIFGIKANGNITCGRINAGEASTSSYDNYNISLIDDPDFSEEMNGYTPDSLTVWVKYVPQGNSDVYRARIAATIHDAYNYRDPAPEDATENDRHIVAKAVLDYAATEDKGWQRISIPFDYTAGPATLAEYILVTFTSNKVAGAGSGDDSVYIDDIVLIYNPSLEIDQENATIFSRGHEMNIAYTLEGTMSATNLLSDKNTVSLQLMKEGTELMTIAELISGTYNGFIASEENEESESQGLSQVVIITATDEEEITLQLNDFTLPVEGEMTPVGNVTFTDVPVKQQGGEYSFAIFTSLDLPILSNISVELNGKIDVNGSLSLSISMGEIMDVEFKDGISENSRILTLATLTTDYSGVLTAVLPEDFEIGSYKGRVVTTNYPMVSEYFTVEVGPTALVALEADEIEETSFMARWGETTEENAVYLLTVKSYGNIVEGYDNLEISGQTTYRVENLEPGRAYTYTVKAQVNGYVSIDSNEIEVRTLGENPVPEPVLALDPENVTAHSFVAKWEQSEFENLTEYLLTVKQAGEILAGYEAVSTGLESSYEVTGLQPETEYTYFVVVRSEEYCSQESNEISVTTPIYVPASVEALEAENIDIRSFTAKWEQAEEVTEYLLTVKQGNSVIYNGISTGLDTSYEVTDLQPNTEYTYSVVVKVDNYSSEESNVVSVTTKEFIPASIVALEAENVGSHSFTARWEASEYDDVTEYLLTVKQGDEVVYDAVSAELNISYEVTDLQPNTEYTYSVVVRVEEEFYSEKSNEVTVTTARFIPAPVAALDPLAVTENSFIARWESSEVATGYQLTVRQNETVINIYSPGLATMQLVDGLEANTEYIYVVQVIADDEISEESNEITVKTSGGVGIDAESTSQFTLYPSPARDYLYISGSKEGNFYYITTVTGSVVKTGTLLTGEIDVKDLIQGVYFIQIDDVKAKFIKE